MVLTPASPRRSPSTEGHPHRPRRQHAHITNVAWLVNGGHRPAIGDGPDRRRGVQSVSAGFGQQRRKRRLHCAWPEWPLPRSGHHHGHEPDVQYPELLPASVTDSPARASRCSTREASPTAAPAGSPRFAATGDGANNQQVLWSVTEIGCANPGVCGSIDSTGRAPSAALARPGSMWWPRVRNTSPNRERHSSRLTTARGFFHFLRRAPTQVRRWLSRCSFPENFSPPIPGPVPTIPAARRDPPRAIECAMHHVAGRARPAIGGNLAVQ